MSIEYPCGRVGKQSISEIADKAARILMERRAAMALTVDLEGRVVLEKHEHAVIDDIVGVYSRDPGLLALWRTISDDLAHEVAQRGLGPVAKRRVVGRPWSSKRRAAA